MMKTLFGALTISLLYTLVYSHVIAPNRVKNDKNVFCLKQKSMNICFPKKETKSLCRQGISFPESQYRECLQSSDICDAPGTFPVPRFPSRYYKCTLNEVNGNFKKEKRVCDEGKTFDVRAQKCLTQEEMLISKSIHTINNDCLPTCKKPDTIANEYDCKSFYMCTGRETVPIKLYCAPRKYFNEKYGTCTDFMTKTCLEKLRSMEITTRERAKKHYCAVKKVLEQQEGFSGAELSDDYDDDDDDDDDYNDIDDYDDYDDNIKDLDALDKKKVEAKYALLNMRHSMSDVDNNDMKYDISLQSLISFALSLGSKIRNMFSSPSNDGEDAKAEINKVFEELWEQREENDKMLEEMHEEDEETIEVGKLLTLNNHLLKGIAEELNEYMKVVEELWTQNKYVIENSQENDKKLEKLRYWVVLGRDQIAFASHLRHLAKLLQP